ncbi:hypothetical protein B0H11DRAFT_2188983 [Mycena galericulata]|nr:hypothetical protein B0H11DRAFT_2188983 [Mycena galericulata]
MSIPQNLSVRSEFWSDNLKELCEDTVTIIEIVRDQISAHGDTAALKFKKLCEELEKCLQEILDTVKPLQKKPKGLSGRFKEVIKLSSTTEQITGFHDTSTVSKRMTTVPKTPLMYGNGDSLCSQEGHPNPAVDLDGVSVVLGVPPPGRELGVPVLGVLLADMGAEDKLRLETLLESALATLMLLHDAAITPVAHTTHTFEVLAALNRRISAPANTAPPHTAPMSAPDAPATSAALDKDTKTTSMTYARAVSAETPRLPSPSPSDSDQSDIVIRLDCAGLSEYTRVYPPSVLHAIQTVIPGKLFAGVRWTRNKNLVLQIEPGTVSASYMIETYTLRIWDALKPILHFPDNHPSPVFETGGSWHSVVFHNLPAAKHDCYALLHVQDSLREGGFNHVVKAVSILCDDQELERRVKNKIPISMRVSVLTEAAAQQLVDRGGHIVGGIFRATHYLAKPRTLAPRPKSVLNDE